MKQFRFAPGIENICVKCTTVHYRINNGEPIYFDQNLPILIISRYRLDSGAVQITILDAASGNLVDFVVLEEGSGGGSPMANSRADYSANAFRIFSQLAVTTG